MIDRKINSLQISSILVLIMVSSFMGMELYSIIKASGVDAYISVAIACILGLPILLLFLYIFSYEPTLALPDKLNKLYGPIFGKIFSLLIAIFIFITGVNLMFNLNNFIVSQFLPETPILVVGIFFSLVIVYANWKGLETISRVSLIILAINIILFIIGLIGLLPNFSIDNLKPVLEFGIDRPFSSSFYVLTLSLIPIFILLIVPKEKLVDHKKSHRFFIGSYFLSFLLIFVITLFTIAVLGIYLASIYQYPEYIVLKHINLFGFLDRIENIITAQWIFGLFFSITFVVYYISNSIKISHKSKWLPFSITTLILLASTYLIPNNTIFNFYIYHIVTKLQVGLLVMMIIIGSTIFFKYFFKKKTNSH